MYYRVLVASQRYHKNEALTYLSTEELLPGSIVRILLQDQLVLGIITTKTKKPAFKIRPIQNLVSSSALDSQHLLLLDWLKNYYPAPGGLIHSLCAPFYLLSQTSLEPLLPRATMAKQKQPPLTIEQKVAIETIEKMSGHSALLHGITGSGKTRIYTELVAKSLEKGQSAIILTPEIGLTPQLTTSFTDLFTNVVVLHSGMTPKERRQVWLAIAHANKPMVVIGPRSALFAPLKSVGLIVVDEMHDSAYKQEQAPYYLTSRVAAKLAELYGCKVILASATPPVTDYFIFEQHHLPIITMTENATGVSGDIDTAIIDLKKREQFSQSDWLSNELVEQMRGALKRKQQSLLFLNRRGTARIILCQVCGWQAICPRCDLPLTYHGDSHLAICHTCGYKESAPSVCPVCSSTEIIFRSAGTKTIVDELQRLLPEAQVQRFDSDVKKGERLQQHYSGIIAGKVDILVGTQMLGKGLDLPKLSVVGVIQADTALNFPDYTAQERTFQLLTQVVGRVGRGHVPSHIVIQTYNPQSTVIQQALTKNYESFYRNQLQERKKFLFPPYCYLLKLTCARRSQTTVKQTSLKLFEQLQGLKLDVEVIGPSPAFAEKTNDLYRWQLVIKATKRSDLLKIIPILPANWLYDLDPTHLL